MGYLVKPYTLIAKYAGDSAFHQILMSCQSALSIIHTNKPNKSR